MKDKDKEEVTEAGYREVGCDLMAMLGTCQLGDKQVKPKTYTAWCIKMLTDDVIHKYREAK